MRHRAMRFVSAGGGVSLALCLRDEPLCDLRQGTCACFAYHLSSVEFADCTCDDCEQPRKGGVPDAVKAPFKHIMHQVQRLHRDVKESGRNAKRMHAHSIRVEDEAVSPLLRGNGTPQTQEYEDGAPKLRKPRDLPVVTLDRQWRRYAEAVESQVPNTGIGSQPQHDGVADGSGGVQESPLGVHADAIDAHTPHEEDPHVLEAVRLATRSWSLVSFVTRALFAEQNCTPSHNATTLCVPWFVPHRVNWRPSVH